MRYLGDIDTAVYSFRADVRAYVVEEPVYTARWVIGGEECTGVQCCKPVWISYQSMVLVCEADETAVGFICCEGFSDSAKVHGCVDGIERLVSLFC